MLLLKDNFSASGVGANIQSISPAPRQCKPLEIKIMAAPSIQPASLVTRSSGKLSGTYPFHFAMVLYCAHHSSY